MWSDETGTQHPKTQLTQKQSIWHIPNKHSPFPNCPAALTPEPFCGSSTCLSSLVLLSLLSVNIAPATRHLFKLTYKESDHSSPRNKLMSCAPVSDRLPFAGSPSLSPRTSCLVSQAMEVVCAFLHTFLLCLAAFLHSGLQHQRVNECLFSHSMAGQSG